MPGLIRKMVQRDGFDCNQMRLLRTVDPKVYRILPILSEEVLPQRTGPLDHITRSKLTVGLHFQFLDAAWHRAADLNCLVHSTVMGEPSRHSQVRMKGTHDAMNNAWGT